VHGDSHFSFLPYAPAASLAKKCKVTVRLPQMKTSSASSARRAPLVLSCWGTPQAPETIFAKLAAHRTGAY